MQHRWIWALWLTVFLGTGITLKNLPETLPEAPPAWIPQAVGRDFPIYWTAWQLVGTGQSLQESQAFQPYLRDSLDSDFALHNPPWILLGFLPFALMPFPTALTAWLLVNAIAALLAVRGAFALFGIPHPPPLLYALGLCFPPLFTCLFYGQITLMLTTLMLALLVFLIKKQACAAGLCLAIATVKPHLFFIFVVFLAADWVRTRQWAVPAWGAVHFSLLLLLTCWIHPQALSNWWQWAIEGGASGWMTATLSSWVRLLTWHLTGAVADWPTALIPSTALVVAMVWNFKREGPKPLWNQFIWGIGLSLVFAPYAWSYDFVLLLPWHISCVVIGYRWIAGGEVPVPIWPAFLPVALWAAWTAQLLWLSTDMHAFVWVPVSILASWWAIRRSPGVVDLLAGHTIDSRCRL